MNPVLDLVTAIERLRAQHRSGIVPPFGEIESLFDPAADVRGAIATGQVTFYQHRMSNQLPTMQLAVELKDAGGQVIGRQLLALSSEASEAPRP